MRNKKIQPLQIVEYKPGSYRAEIGPVRYTDDGTPVYVYIPWKHAKSKRYQENRKGEDAPREILLIQLIK